MEVEIRLRQALLFHPSDLPLNQFIEVGQPRRLVEPYQIRLDCAGLHQVNASQQHPVHIKERFDPRRVLFLEELPLGFREAEVMVRVVLGHAMGRDHLQFGVFWRRLHHQRRKYLLQHVAVLFEQQAEELLGVVRHQVDLDPVVNARLLYGFGADAEADHLFERQDVDASQIEVRIRRRKAVQMRSADRGEEQRVRMLLDLFLQQRHWHHGNSSDKARRRALMRNALARS
jgi:hypothetical protein